jgi:sulfur relay (sulfurtransferase) complex TusBCD TusD component (DsrE family)
MAPTGKKLGILVSRPPDHPAFQHGLKLAAAAVNAGATVYLYCIDEAVHGLNDTQLQSLRAAGLRLFACAYAAQQRRIPLSDAAAFSGLSVVTDLITATDRFVSFN